MLVLDISSFYFIVVVVAVIYEGIEFIEMVMIGKMNLII